MSWTRPPPPAVEDIRSDLLQTTQKEAHARQRRPRSRRSHPSHADMHQQTDLSSPNQPPHLSQSPAALPIPSAKALHVVEKPQVFAALNCTPCCAYAGLVVPAPSLSKTQS